MSRQVNLGQIVPNVQIGTTTTSLPGTSASVENVGTSLNPILNFTIPRGEPGAIKMLIVAELPSTGADDTIYLVPITPDTSGNNYAEYVYINGAWELLGKIGVHVDLTDYVKNTDYATAQKGGVVKVNSGYGVTLANGVLIGNASTYSNYNSSGEALIISKGTLENVITGKNLVSNTNYATTSKAGVIKLDNSYAVNVSSSSGNIYADTRTYEFYQTANNGMFIGKGTLDNVITGKGLVSNTDYASQNTAGVFKTLATYGTAITNDGYLYGATRTNAQYESGNDGLVISKGTLENVLTARIGAIDEVIDNINGEVI